MRVDTRSATENAATIAIPNEVRAAAAW
jgi:hypothetical protein